jgi:hypothetical protein
VQPLAVAETQIGPTLLTQLGHRVQLADGQQAAKSSYDLLTNPRELG